MEYIHNSLKDLLDKLEYLNKFINQHLKNLPPIIRSDQTILRKSQFSRRENEEDMTKHPSLILLHTLFG